MRIEVLAIGREILSGRTLDTNSHWIARQVASLGGRLSRIAAVDDDETEIVSEIASARDRGVSVLITTGGLGPTSDDKTLAAIAAAAGLDLVECASALRFVSSRYEEFHAAGHVDSPILTPERRKMALLPRGSLWLDNAVGAAPGVRLTLDGMTVFALPGVPAEMKDIFTRHVIEHLRRLLEGRVLLECRVVTGIGDESVLGPILDAVAGSVPGVYLKSTPRRFGQEEGIEVYISVWGEDEDLSRRKLTEAKDMLLRLAAERGGRCRS